jgi:hypothetical protein
MHATHTTPLRERMRQELQLAGLSERTYEAYLRAVCQLATHFGKPPDHVTEPELRQYLLFLKNEKHFAPASLKIASYGIRFFFNTTVPRDWPTLRQLRIPKQQTLPDVHAPATARAPAEPSSAALRPLPANHYPIRSRRLTRAS